MTDPIDPEAPYGRNPKTGEPYKRSPDERARLAANLQGAKRTRSVRQDGGRRTPRAQGSKASSKPGYAQTVLQLLQVPAFGLQVASRFNPTLGLDALALTLHAPDIAEAVESVAYEQPAMAAVLERIGSVGPYGALGVAILPLMLQLAANHGAIKPNPDMGILDPVSLMRESGLNVDQDASEHAGHSPVPAV